MVFSTLFAFPFLVFSVAQEPPFVQTGCVSIKARNVLFWEGISLASLNIQDR